MTASTGICRKFWQETQKQLLPSGKPSAFSHKSAQEALQPSVLSLGSQPNASSSSIRQPNRLFSSRESLADEPAHLRFLILLYNWHNLTVTILPHTRMWGAIEGCST